MSEETKTVLTPQMLALIQNDPKLMESLAKKAAKKKEEDLNKTVTELLSVKSLRDLFRSNDDPRNFSLIEAERLNTEAYNKILDLDLPTLARIILAKDKLATHDLDSLKTSVLKALKDSPCTALQLTKIVHDLGFNISKFWLTEVLHDLLDTHIISAQGNTRSRIYSLNTPLAPIPTP